MWIHGRNGEDVIRVDDDVVECARKLVKMEATCIEWGASAERSVEIAAMAIMELLEARERQTYGSRL
jgi:hypothetical protein